MKRKLRKILRNIDYKNKIVLDLGTGLGTIKELSDLCENTTLVGLSDKHSFIEAQKQMVKSNFYMLSGNINIYLLRIIALILKFLYLPTLQETI